MKIGSVLVICEKIYLKDVCKEIKSDAYVRVICQDNFEEFNLNRKRKALVIVPGGAYVMCSEREAEPVALKFAAEDIAIFILNYTTGDFDYPAPIDEVLATIKFIRNNSEKYHVNTNGISVLGFSAGGHLVASSALYNQDEYFLNLLNTTKEEIKINGVLLAYPVITMGPLTHFVTRDLRCKGDAKMMDMMSIEKNVTKDYPPTFIWVTGEDLGVSPLNSILMAKALMENEVTTELHVYPKYNHGLATADSITNDRDYEDVKTWINHAIYFIKHRV